MSDAALATPRPESRADANKLALRVAGAILDGARPFEFSVDGRRFEVSVERAPHAPWPPGGLEGLDERTDGPLPRAVTLRCRWPDGSVALLMQASWWRGQGAYRHLVGIRIGVEASNQEILWITIALPLRDAADGQEVVLQASFTPFRRKEEQPDPAYSSATAIKRLVAAAELPFASTWKVEAGRISVPDAKVTPSPSEVFRRLVTLALIKLPFFVRRGQAGIDGKPPFEPAEGPAGSEAGALDELRDSLWPLPGGVRQYKDTLDELLREIEREPKSLEEMYALLKERYEASGETARKGYIAMLRSLGLCSIEEDRLTLTEEGAQYLARPDPDVLFERLRSRYKGVLEVLVIAEQFGHADTARTLSLLNALQKSSWKSNNQPSFRRNWLLSLAYLDRTAKGDALTPAGREALKRHPAEADEVREALRRLATEQPEILENLDDPDPGDDGDDDQATPPRPPPAGVPPAWNAERIDLREGTLVPFANELEVPQSTLVRIAAALSAGKHLLLVGPPGTGKTELAHSVAEAAKSEGYCAGLFAATASADWTTFDTIGGYALQKDGSLAFRPGVLLRALEGHQWLLVDEINRADVDRAFGEMLTVLAGRSTDTAYETRDGNPVRIGPDLRATHRMPPTFRVIATMNTWDKTSLFRLSYAVQRRFAVVHVGIPDDDAYRRLLARHAAGGIDPAIDEASLSRVANLFSRAGLLRHRQVGPAVALDVMRYLRRRNAQGDGLAEALAIYVLPQLEGLEEQPARLAFEAMQASVRAWSSPGAAEELRARFEDYFPHVPLPQA